MISPPSQSRNERPAPALERRREGGFTLVETIAASALLLFAFLSLSGAFVLGYARINGSGNSTVGLSAARQLLEEMRRLPFDSLINLDGFDTDDPATLPAGDPERESARRWRYAVAGPGVGWTFSSNEESRWTTFAGQGDALEATGAIQVTSLSANLVEVSVTVIVPGTWRQVQISTRITRLS